MQGKRSALSQVLMAIVTGDNTAEPAGSLAGAVEASGDDIAGAGRLGADGYQIVLRTATGHCVIKAYLRDAVAPLIIARAGALDGDLSTASCCMTEVDCGGGLKCLSAEDPCPGGKVTDPWLGGQLGPLLGSEIRLIEALAAQMDRLANESPADRVWSMKSIGEIRARHEHRQLLFAVEEDGPGAWYDWILRLSNGTSLHIELSTNPRRTAPVFSNDEFRSVAIERSSRISLVPTDTGERLLLPRMFVGQ